MGLTITYRMKARIGTDRARDLIARMQKFARTLEFDSVSDIFEYTPPDGRYEFEKAESNVKPVWKPGTQYLTRTREDGMTECVEVPSIHAMTFSAQNAGSERASIGLATQLLD